MAEKIRKVSAKKKEIKNPKIDRLPEIQERKEYIDVLERLKLLVEKNDFKSQLADIFKEKNNLLLKIFYLGTGEHNAIFVPLRHLDSALKSKTPLNASEKELILVYIKRSIRNFTKEIDSLRRQ